MATDPYIIIGGYEPKFVAKEPKFGTELKFETAELIFVATELEKPWKISSTCRAREFERA